MSVSPPTSGDALRILEIATEVPPFRGGISRLVGALVEGLQKAHHEVVTLSPRRRFGEFKLSSIPLRRYGDFDVLHVWGPTPFLSDCVFLTNRGLKLVYTHVADICWKSEFVSRAYRRLNDRVARNASMAITLSDDYATELSTRGFRNVEVIRPPFRFGEVDKSLDSLLKSKNSTFTVLYVGQLRPFKAVDVLIRAAAEMKDLDFIIEGRGYLQESLEQLAHRLSCKNVRFVKTKGDEDLIRLYEASHIICLPSRNTTEAYGLVLLEGAAFACVPIASNLLGVAENVKQLHGFTVPPNNPESLTSIVKTLTADHGKWTHFAKDSYFAARKYALEYSTSYYVNRHLEIFSRL
jgi:glycosyltransferase involved in cell wall biosynthesis